MNSALVVWASYYPSFLKDSFATYIYYSWLRAFVFQHFEYIIPLASDCKVSAELSPAVLWGFLSHDKSLFSFLLQNSLHVFLTLTIWFYCCLGVDFFEFMFLGVCWASWIWMSISFPKFGKLWAIISLNKLSGPSLYLILQLHMGSWNQSPADNEKGLKVLKS